MERTEHLILISGGRLPTHLGVDRSILAQHTILRQADDTGPEVVRCLVKLDDDIPAALVGAGPADGIRRHLTRIGHEVGLLVLQPDGHQILHVATMGCMHPIGALSVAGPPVEDAAWIDHALACWRRACRRRVTTLRRLESARPGIRGDCNALLKAMGGDRDDLLHRSQLTSVLATVFDIDETDARILLLAGPSLRSDD